MNFQTTATAQALASFKRWSNLKTMSQKFSVAIALWEGNVVAGTVGNYTAEQHMLKIERWINLHTVEDRARYMSTALGHRKQPQVNEKMPKLCPDPTSHEGIQILTDVQAVAPRLLTPGGPLRRLLLQLPPGAGKTCTYVATIAQFLGNGHTIVIVCDDDTMQVFKDGLRDCPARVVQRMRGPDKNPLPEETVYLRRINEHLNEFCVLNCKDTNPALQYDSSFKCPGGATWINTRVYFFNFTMAGNWMDNWTANKTSSKTKSMYDEINPFSDKLLIVVDEAHKLGMPTLEKTTARWQAQVTLFPKYMASLGKDPTQNPYILCGTATVNTTPMPTLSLCLPRVIKGKMDARIFKDDDVTKAPKIDLHNYLNPSFGFVRIKKEFLADQFPLPGHEGERKRLIVKQLSNRLEKYKGFDMDKPTGKNKEKEDLAHPCPLTAEARLNASFFIYEPVDNEENRKKLIHHVLKGTVIVIVIKDTW